MNTSGLQESDLAAGLKVDTNYALNYRIAAGLEVSSYPIQLNDDIFAQVSGSLSASYSDAIGSQNVQLFLGHERHVQNTRGPSSELSIDVGAGLSLFGRNRQNKAEFSFFRHGPIREYGAISLNMSLKFSF